MRQVQVPGKRAGSGGKPGSDSNQGFSICLLPDQAKAKAAVPSILIIADTS